MYLAFWPMGRTEKEAIASAQALALRAVAGRIEQAKELTDTVIMSIENH